jgi:hypothetical protein
MYTVFKIKDDSVRKTLDLMRSHWKFCFAKILDSVRSLMRCRLRVVVVDQLFVCLESEKSSLHKSFAGSEILKSGGERTRLQ